MEMLKNNKNILKNDPVIGVIFNDLDYFSSTLDSFKFLKNKDKFYLPEYFVI